MNPNWKQRFIAAVAALHGRQLIRFFASRLRDAADAQDLAQEVYLRLLRLDQPELIRSPEAYLFTIAANLVREHSLKRAARPVHVALEDAPGDQLPFDTEVFSPATPEEAAGRAERMRSLERALGRLSPKARAALIWHRRDGKTYDEIGVRLGVSRNMVKKYLSQALAHCRKCRDEQGEDV
jgi:RNA polymerase sigma factor (sigma-70 family)